MKYWLVTILSLFCSLTLSANNVAIENLTRNGDEITFDLSWDNSWNYNGGGQTHSDMVYIFIKQAANGGPSWAPAKISSGTATNSFSVTVPADQLAVRIGHNYANVNAYTSVTLNLTGLNGAYQDLKVMAHEMVRVPVGAFSLGDGISDRSYYQGDDPTASYIVDSEDEITRGSTADDFDGGSANYSGDIGADFPKGYNDFYCMKYLVTQQQYVDFLNCLPRNAQDTRTASDLSGTTVTNNFVMGNSQNPSLGNGISCDNNIGTGNITFFCDYDNDGIPNEDSDGQHKIATYLNNADVYAYLDWAGLAPMTSLQYEKACRGPLAAVAEEFAWGSTVQNASGSVLNNGTPQEIYSNSGTDGGIIGPIHTQRVGLNAPTANASRELSNASYYGIVGLSGRADVHVIPISGNYTGEQGDGELSISGEANFMDTTVSLQSKGYTAGAGKGRVSSYNGVSLVTSSRNYKNAIIGIWYIVL